ncbi:MAG: hypothetical protein KC543_14030 [Myxococcales bacterium]|nr:hypothetical protein [Myxococcales bacterium]
MATDAPHAEPDRDAEARARAAIARLPALGGLAALAVAADVAFNDFLVRSVGSDWPRESALWLSRAGRFPRYLAAIACLVALIVGLFELTRPGVRLAIFVRATLATFAGFVVAPFAFAIVAPAASLPVPSVLLTATAAYALAILLGLSAMRWRVPPLQRAGNGIATATAICAVVALVALVFGAVGRYPRGLQVHGWAHQAGEVLYLAAPLALGFGARLWSTPRRARYVAATVLIAALLMAGLLAWARAVGPDADDLWYAALHLDLLLRFGLRPYALIYAVAAALGLLSFIADRAEGRQYGVAIWLWLAAGFSPTTAVGALAFLLSMTLIARAAAARAVEGAGDAA